MGPISVEKKMEGPPVPQQKTGCAAPKELAPEEGRVVKKKGIKRERWGKKNRHRIHWGRGNSWAADDRRKVPVGGKGYGNRHWGSMRKGGPLEEGVLEVEMEWETSLIYRGLQTARGYARKGGEATEILVKGTRRREFPGEKLGANPIGRARGGRMLSNPMPGRREAANGETERST